MFCPGSIDGKRGCPFVIHHKNIASSIESHTRDEKRGNIQYDSPHIAASLVLVPAWRR